MAINKTKNRTIQVTFPKEDAENLETFQRSLENNGIRKTKSEILAEAFNFMLRFLGNITIDKKTEEQGGNENNA